MYGQINLEKLELDVSIDLMKTKILCIVYNVRKYLRNIDREHSTVQSQSVSTMLSRKDIVLCFLLLWIFMNNAKCQDIEEMSKTLDKMLINTRSFRRPRDHDDTSLVWQEYEFGTGTGNREDIVVTNISLHRFTDMPENIDWQLLQTDTAYFIRAVNSTLLFYEINFDNLLIAPVISVKTEGHILHFKVLNLDVEETFDANQSNNLIAVLFVESQNGYYLYWYRIFGNTYTLYLTWPMQKKVRNMEFVREKNQHELLLLDDAYHEEESLIDIYGFNVDYNNRRIDMWLCRRLFIPKLFNVQVCPIYGRTVLAFQGINSIVLYESKNEDKLCQFEEFEVIKSNNFTNFVCFESGYIEYLAIGGKELRLFHFFENEFQDNTETDLHLDETDIFWITTVPLNTYRDESLLLVQLKNFTVIALAWHGSKFKIVPLPNQIMNNLDLSKTVPIPKFGFVHTNTLVRIEVSLSQLAHLIHDETESMLKTQALLEEVFRKQEAVFNETEVRLNQSYFKHPTITEFWNLSTVDVSNATIKKHVNYGAVKVGSIDLEMEDILTNVTSSIKKLEKFEAKLDENYLSKNMTNITRINLPLDIELIGDFIVNGTLYAKSVTTALINNASTSIRANNNVNRIANVVIDKQKSFPSIDTDNLTVLSLNGIPLEEIVFDTSIRNYSNIDFSKLKRLEIDGHFNFTAINNYNWKNLIQSIVWKDKSAIISGETIVEGQLIAEETEVRNLNHLQYPEDYILINDKSFTNVTGEKYFVNLSTTHLLGINRINEIDIEDFVILSRHEVIKQEITFENLEIGGTFQIDGNITGIDISNIEGFLNETDRLLSDVIFENLNVMGNIILQSSINSKTWSDLDNLLLKIEEAAIITGNKKFLSGVNIKSNARISSGQVNDHLFSDFVTLNTNQQFPHLKKISAHVMFGNITLGIIKKLKDYIIHEQDIASGCLNKVLLFIKSPIIDYLTFDTLQQTISQIAFFKKLNQTFEEMYFENLTISALMADEVLPNTINGINYTDLAKRMLTISTQQNLTGTLIVDDLKTNFLDAKTINGMSVNKLNRLLTNAKLFYDDIFNGNTSIGSLRVTGIITASSINENDIIDIYKEDSMATVIFNENVSIKDLIVIGFVNGLNLTEFVSDAIQKTDRNVTFTGRKTFENVTCQFLDTRFINEHFIGDILDFNKKQILKGPIVVNGSITVLRNFNTTGKIGDMLLRHFTDRFKLLGDNSYELCGNFYFTETASLTKLNVSGPIQGLMFDSFMKRIIPKNDTNVTISGSKLFKSPVTFSGAFIVDGSLNDLDLRKFHESAVYINKPFSINTKVMFKEDVYVQKNIVITTKLQSSTIMDVDMKDLQENAVALNKPRYFPAWITLDNVTFQTNINVVRVNNLQMDTLISLHTKQFIMIDKLNCTNVTIKNIQISGRVNTYDLDDIYTDTFMIYGNQNITGNIKIRGNVYAYHDFNAHLINNFNPKRIVSLTVNDTLIGNFMFKTPVVLDKSLKILGLLNGISPINWQRIAIKTTDKQKQLISAKWRINGNVYFKKNINGNEFLNGINITQISTVILKEHPQIDLIEEAYDDLYTVCALHLDALKYNAANQIYKFNMFDYLQILEFEGDIHDIRYVELNDMDYMLVNFDICRLKLLLNTQTGFRVVDEVSNFGLIDRWIFFKSNRALYLLTIAKSTCGSSFNNIWQLKNDKLMHVLELGNYTDTDLHQDVFVAMIHENLETASENVQSDILEALQSYKNEKLNSTLNSDSIVLATQYLTYELQERSSNSTHLENCLNCSSQLNFKIGIYEKEEYIYYNENVSQDYIYLCKNDISQTRIVQTIKVHRPKSFLILNFDRSVETLLIFTENNDTIQIYEYRGIKGFVHRNAIKMKVDKLYNFKIRKYTNLKRRHCLAAVNENRLTILKAEMYGETLDLNTTAMDFCYRNTYSVY